MNLEDPQAHDFLQTSIPIIKELKAYVQKAYVDGNTTILDKFTTYKGRMTSIFSESTDDLSDGDKFWFVDCFLQLSRYGLPNNTSRVAHNTDTLNSYGTWKGSDREASTMSATNTLSLLEENNNVNGNKVNQGLSAHPTTVVDVSKDGWIVRENVASSFFHFLQFAKPLVNFKNVLYPTIVDLMHDPIPSVRAKIAENIFPSMQFLKREEGTLLQGQVQHALSDDNITVIEGVVQKLGDILKLFVQNKSISPENVTSFLNEIGDALLLCEERLSQTNNWRVHAIMLEQLSILPFCFPGDYIFNNFVPALFHRLLHIRQLPCRVAGAESIVSFLRHCRRSSQREEIRKRIKNGFAKGRKAHDRMLFLFMSKKIMKIFSRKYFREHFFETTLALTEDNVANIRLKAVQMMPDLKRVLQMSETLSLLNELEETLRRIEISESDRDVRNVISSVISEMANIEVIFKCNQNGPKTKEDLEDETKEREEEYISNLEPASSIAKLKGRRNLCLYKFSHSESPNLPSSLVNLADEVKLVKNLIQEENISANMISKTVEHA